MLADLGRSLLSHARPGSDAMRWSLCFVLSVSLPAQGGSIFVVDAAGGGGAHYSSLPAAIAAVPDGSTLLVRPGTYAPATIDGKGLTVLGDPAFVVSGFAPSLTVRNTLPHQRVLVSRLSGSSGRASVVVENTAGPVTIDAVDSPSLGGGGDPPFQLTNAAQVTIRTCFVEAAFFTACVEAVGSNVVLENCTLNGWSAEPFGKASFVGAVPAVRAAQSHVQVVHSVIRGGNGLQVSFGVVPASAAVALQSSSLRVMGTNAHALLGGVTPLAGPVAALAGTGTARVEPQIPFSGAAAGVSLVRPEMPSLLADSAPPGGVLNARRSGPGGVLSAMTLSLRAPLTIVPGLPDPVGIDPSHFFVEAAVVTAPGSVFAVGKLVPNQVQLRGFEFVWQAFDLTPSGVIAASNPSPGFVR
jgi:hypothetical protein